MCSYGLVGYIWRWDMSVYGRGMGCFVQLVMFENSMSLVARGSGSELFVYGGASGRVVLKVVCSSSRREQVHLRNEFQVLKGLEHQHIIRALRYQERVAFQGNTLAKQFVTKNILVLEFAQEGSLLAFLTSHSTPSLTLKRTLFAQLLNAVTYLHDRGIAHRDLKLENVLLFRQEGELTIKLGDFGFAGHFEREGRRVLFNEYKGTRKGYMAPEIHACHHAPEKRYDGELADMFALGVLMFALVMGKLPFQLAVPENKLYGLIIQGKFEEFWAFHHQVNGIFSEELSKMELFQSLFQRMVSVKAEERPRASEVAKDAWLV